MIQLAAFRAKEGRGDSCLHNMLFVLERNVSHSTVISISDIGHAMLSCFRAQLACITVLEGILVHRFHTILPDFPLIPLFIS